MSLMYVVSVSLPVEISNNNASAVKTLLINAMALSMSILA